MTHNESLMSEKAQSAILAKNLKALRRREDISQDVLAERTGLSTGAIKQIETEKRWPRPETLALLAQALGVHQSALLADPDREQPRIDVGPLTAEQFKAISDMIRTSVVNEMRKAPRTGTTKIEYSTSIPEDILEALNRADDDRLFRVRLALGIDPIVKQAPKVSKKKA